jgi:hypothetical protein
VPGLEGGEDGDSNQDGGEVACAELSTKEVAVERQAANNQAESCSQKSAAAQSRLLPTGLPDHETRGNEKDSL